MHGVGRSSSAITIVNALPTGVGAAVGIGLQARAEVAVRPARSAQRPSLEIPAEVRSPLVEEALRTGLARFFPSAPSDATLTVRSEIPIARGLKSSSAVSCAVLSAVAQAARASVAPIELARLSADVSLRTGTSATGALDDALAGLSNGFVLTDNRRGTVLREEPVPEGWEALLLVPPTAHRPAPEWSASFRAEATASSVAVEAARQGKWWSAMEHNTVLVERVLGLAYAELRGRLRERGAIASGVSGLGPALAAVAPSARAAEVLAALPSSDGARLRVPLGGSAEPVGSGAP